MTKKWRVTMVLKTAVTATVVFWLAACAIQPEGGVQIVSGQSTPVLTEEELKQYLQEWQAAKPGIERLTELEADLSFLIAEVSRMSELNNAPEKYADMGTEVINGDNVIVSTMSSSNGAVPQAAETTSDIASTDVDTNVTQTSSGYAVHLASFLKPQSARFGWYVVQQEFPSLLSGMSPKLLQVNRAQQQLYSLRFGPFSRDIDAVRACNVLKRRNYKCELTSYAGTEMVIM